MNLVRVEPWSIADLVQRDSSRLTQRHFVRSDTESAAADWVPAVDIVEEKERFILRADVPGVAAADIDVSMEDGVLTVSGQRSAEAEGESDGVRRIERSSGRFFRRFSLPDTADAQDITAKTADGILDITIPKLPEVQPRRITVEAA